MMIISLAKNESGVHTIEDHPWMARLEQIPEGFVQVPGALCEKVWGSLGWCDLILSRKGTLRDIIPLGPVVDMEDLRRKKTAEISAACEAAIFAGVTVETTQGPERFSLTLNDQTNLANLALQAQTGAPALYHADGELCRIFTPEEVLSVTAAATRHKIYHTTYVNHLLTWVRRAQTAEELAATHYGAALPDDLARHMDGVLSKMGELYEKNL